MSPKHKLIFDIISIFPEMFNGPLNESIIKRAIEQDIVAFNLMNLRDFADDKHHTVDDTLYGGIPGMLFKCGPLACAIRSAKAKRAALAPRVILLSPQGKPLTQEMINEFASNRSLILVCGRYKGIDARINDLLIDEEVSIGHFVVSGGELPAMLLADAVVRRLPGALHDEESARSDSLIEGLLEAPNYTRPEVFEGMRVPDVLLSGHHEKIRKWRQDKSLAVTKEKRPDLFKDWQNTSPNN